MGLELFTGDKLCVGEGGRRRHWGLLFVNSNVTEIQLVHHKVHSFQVYTSMLWGLFRVVHPNAINSRAFLSPQFEILYL